MTLVIAMTHLVTALTFSIHKSCLMVFTDLKCINTLVNVYVDLVVFTLIARVLHRPEVVDIGVNTI